MDPFSISTGVAGLLSLAIELSTILDNYVSGFKSAPEDADRILNEIDALCHVLKDLVKFLRDEDKHENQSFSQTSFLCSTIRMCQEEIQKLCKKFNKFHAGVDKTKMAELTNVSNGPYVKTITSNLYLGYRDLPKPFSFRLWFPIG